MRALFLFLALCAFWVLLSGEIQSAYLMGVGVFCCAITTWFSVRLEIVGDEGQPTRGIRPFIAYLPWLFWQVVLANVDVIKRVWRPERSIEPRFFTLPVQVRHPVAKALYANSITLTPGTVAIKCDDSSFLVHALTDEAEQALRSGDMEQRIQQMEEVSV